MRLSFWAVFTLSPASRYLCLLKIFSSLLICSVVNLVRTRRCWASSISSTERHSEEVASLSYPEEYPLTSETDRKEGKRRFVGLQSFRKPQISAPTRFHGSSLVTYWVTRSRLGVQASCSPSGPCAARTWMTLA